MLLHLENEIGIIDTAGMSRYYWKKDRETNQNRKRCINQVLFFSDSANAWLMTSVGEFKKAYCSSHGNIDTRNCSIIFSIRQWKQNSLLNKCSQYRKGNPNQVLYIYGLKQFKERYPFSAIDLFGDLFCVRNDPDQDMLLAAYALCYMEYPFIEQLTKSGMGKQIYSAIIQRKDSFFLRMFPNGTDTSEITSLKPYQWKLLSESISDCGVWMSFYDLFCNHSFSKDLLRRYLKLYTDFLPRGTDSLFFPSRLNSVLNQKYDNRSIYTPASLCRYLETFYRDTGTIPDETLLLLEDYHRMCIELDRPPALHLKDLKRQHDLTAVEYSCHKDAERATKFQKAFQGRYEQLQWLGYEDDRLKIVIPSSADDIFMEGRNNHNCVASYAELHAKGKNTIVFIRKKDEPEKSYITAEIDDGLNVVQAYYSYNRRIIKEDRAFIDQWIKEVKQRKHDNESSI